MTLALGEVATSWAQLGFPLGIRLTHAFNIIFLTLLIRSGIEIIGGHPMLYFNDHCRPGSEWIRFSSKRMFRDKRWTAEDEKQPYTPWVALPGRDHLGLGRFWHFIAVVGWILTGVVYLLVLFTSEQWQRLVPTTWEIFPQAGDAALSYLQMEQPPPGEPYNALQQLTYFAVVFLLTPLQIVTGMAMSPALEGRFPWFPRLFGGRQAARSFHFIGLVIFVVFTIHHVAIVIAHGLVHGLSMIVMGTTDPTTAQEAAAVAITLAFLAGLAWLHIWATRTSLEDPRSVQRLMQPPLDWIQHRLLQRLPSRQAYRPEDISPTPRPNGRPPRHRQYLELVERGFDGWRFEIGGLVERPLSLSLNEIRDAASQRQITTHKCIQGWSYIAEWEGIPVADLLELCRPRPEARYILFRTFDDKWEEPTGEEFYAVISLEDAHRPQTILAYGFNGETLPTAHGAPLRLRVENQLGYNMAKYVRSMELIADYRQIGQGYGGWRPDKLHYGRIAPI